MPRRAWWFIGCLLLAAWMLATPPRGGAAPPADLPTDTATPRLPTASPTSPPPPTATPTPVTPSATPSTPEPSATPRRPSKGPEPSATPTPLGDPRVVKSVDPSSGHPGDTITFSIVVHNDNSIPATNVEVDDSIPGVFQINGATVSQGTVTVSDQHIHAVIGTIPAGGEVVIRVATVIRADAAPGQVENIAVLTTDTPGDNPGNNTSTVTVTIQGPPVPTAPPSAAPSAVPAPPPATLPRTGGDAPWLVLLALLAIVALLGGLALRARRRAHLG